MSLISQFKKSSNIKILRFLVILFVLGLILIITGVSFFHIDPVGFRRIVFQPTREVLYFQRELKIFSEWDNIEKVKIPPANKVIITNRDGLKIVADLRIPKGQKQAPGFILFHGASPWGRKSGLIRYLAFRLQEKGWVVLSPDARGFGESEDPKDIMDPKAWDTDHDVIDILNYFEVLDKIDPTRIYVLGHSMGALQALQCAVEEDRIKGFILVGPPRVADGFKVLGMKSAKSTWSLARWSVDRGLSHIVEENRVISNGNKPYYERGLLVKNKHKPILFIDGELEGQSNLTLLNSIVQKTTPPVTYRTLSNTGHYCGVYNFFGSDVVYYRPDLFNPFLQIIDDFINQIEKQELLESVFKISSKNF